MENASFYRRQVLYPLRQFLLNLMGNKIVYVYNGTERDVKLEVRLNTCEETPIADAIIHSGCHVPFVDLPRKWPLLTVRVLDDQGTSLSRCDFYSFYDHSWVVTENYVYRQKYGEHPRTIADNADEFKYSEERYSDKPHYKRRYCDVILRYTLQPICNPRTTVGRIWTNANNTEQDKELIEVGVLKLICDMLKGEKLTLELMAEYALKETLLQSVIASQSVDSVSVDSAS